MKKSIKILSASTIGLFFILDQFLKWQSLHNWSETNLLHKFFGWQPFLNSGVAFGLPFPNILQIIFSVIIIIIISYIFLNLTSLNTKKLYLTQYSLLLIIVGAMSNLIDRTIHQNTVDYFLILTGIINIADIMIVVGFVLFFYQNFRQPSKTDNLL